MMILKNSKPVNFRFVDIKLLANKNKLIFEIRSSFPKLERNLDGNYAHSPFMRTLKPLSRNLTI